MEDRASITKRAIMSSIAQIFDPLGLLAPVIINAKLMIQELWKIRAGWDEKLPAEITNGWREYTRKMRQLNGYDVQRKISGDGPDAEFQLHGFCDASERAYGACIYMRTKNNKGVVQTNLICSRSRVDPLKTLSIPRLELCGAQLLARLMHKLKNALEMKISKIYYWTNSSIVLHWIRATNKRLPVFVAHRIGEIQELTAVEDWHHVKSEENAADILSRGCNPEDLRGSTLWWSGPAWLQSREFAEQEREPENPDDWQDGEESQRATFLVIKKIPNDEIIIKFSNFYRLLRVIATCRKFAQLCRGQRELKESQTLSMEELEQAKRCVVGMEQTRVYDRELSALRKGEIMSKNSDLRHLNPWIDEHGLLRVGGRLRNAEVQYSAKHPWVLPPRSKLVELIIQHEHEKNLHAGMDATLAAVRQRYWPIKARSTVRKLLRECIICFRSRPRFSQQVMGDLPSVRVTAARPFSKTGVDFCGPIYIRESGRRNAKRIKSYVAVFVCMIVKAVHIEVVSNMSTDAFLGAFKRFISRRGKPTDIYSDNGTNFIGANRKLEELKNLFASEETKNKIIDNTALEGVKWHFIPAHAPHFGGLWEAAVKSFKNHFYKIVAEASMTLEETITLVNQIEAILNSRPLTAISSDPNDFNYLSPGHFIIGTALTAYPEPNLEHIKINRLSRWQMLERMRQHFWKRWSMEYLTKFQSRNKWITNDGPVIKVGQLVICKEDGLPPLKWALGRVQEVCPGKDNVVRVAIIRTASGTYKRPATKICVLPINDE